MIRKIIEIDREKCVGCGLCVTACKESAIALVDGKATLLREDYCDGLGNCLPVCPTNAIGFIEKDVEIPNKKPASTILEGEKETTNLPCGCPGQNAKVIDRASGGHATPAQSAPVTTHLNQWPVQIKLMPENAPYLDGAKLLIAADCAAYAYGNFHQEFMRNRVTVIGCPKLDDMDYSIKLTAMLKNNNIKSVCVVRMEVPCCGGLEKATIMALKNCGKLIPWEIVTLSTNGEILEV